MHDESTQESNHWEEPVSITKEQWMGLLRDEEITTEQDRQLVQVMYTCDDCRASASQLAQFLALPHHAPLNSQVGRWGKRIVKKLNIQAIKQKHGEGVNWWNVPFWGEGTAGKFYWILRPELQEAIREINVLEEDASLLEIHIPEEIDGDSAETFYEGARKQIYVNRYERNRGARDRCIHHYQAKCIICGFDFEKTYGDIGRDVIHVHHLVPLSDIGETYSIDPIKDLRPVCPNCHVIIHKKHPPYSIDEVVAMLPRPPATTASPPQEGEHRPPRISSA